MQISFEEGLLIKEGEREVGILTRHFIKHVPVGIIFLLSYIYSSLLIHRGMFRDPQWMPKPADSSDAYIHYFYIYTPMGSQTDTTEVTEHARP